jgi:hypothetical protein
MNRHSGLSFIESRISVVVLGWEADYQASTPAPWYGYHVAFP